jgi:hypothetical protein
MFNPLEKVPSIPELNRFFNAVIIDERMTMPHLCLYMALFQCWNINGFHNPILIRRIEVMQLAKISAKSTYHKCIKDLQIGGYIRYYPSYNPLGSLVYILC